MNDIDYINKLRETWDINENIDIESKSIEIVVRIIKLCNENCLFCNTNLSKNIINYEDLIIIFNYFEKKYSNNYKITFSLSWWEPTLHKNLEKIIEFLFNKDFDIKLQTNAVMFSDIKFLNKFKKYSDRLYFFISFHSHIEKIYNYLTTTKLFKKSLKWIINIYENFNNDYIEINTVLNKLNIDFFHSYVLFFDKNFSKYSVNIIMSIIYPNKEHHKRLLVSYYKIIDIINSLNYFWKVKILYEFWGYCQLPMCFYRLLNIKDENKNKVWLDIKVWDSNMLKIDECLNCKFNTNCMWFSKYYLDVFKEEKIKPII